MRRRPGPRAPRRTPGGRRDPRGGSWQFPHGGSGRPAMPSSVDGAQESLGDGRGQLIEHLLLGLGVTAAAVLAAALAPRLTASAAETPERSTDYEALAQSEA